MARSRAVLKAAGIEPGIEMVDLCCDDGLFIGFFVDLRNPVGLGRSISMPAYSSKSNRVTKMFRISE